MNKRASALAFLLAFFPLVAWGEGPPIEPILRIETGMHTAPINRIATDDAGRFLVTGSADKTIRVWDLASGSLLRTLRPPIGPGIEGKIYAVAITPDGKTIAAAGWTGVAWDGTRSIYLLDRATGRLVLRIKGLPRSGLHLAFSRDGQRLAVSLGGPNGIRVFRVADGQEIARDDTYTDFSYGLDWDGSGRLVASSFDGYIRLYDKDLKLAAKVKPTSGKQPFGVSFSPDGQKVACGFENSTSVEVLSGSDLHTLYGPDAKDVKNGDLAIVAWSTDGQTLYAGGRYSLSLQQPIRRWSDSGRGSFRDVLAGVTSTIFDLKPLPRGRLAFGSAEPKWGVLAADSSRERVVDSGIADFRTEGGVRLDSSGTRVRFSYKYGDQQPAVFSVPDRTLTLDPDPSEDVLLAAPRTEAPGLNIAGWFHAPNPAVDGKLLKLEPSEETESMALATDGQSFVLGTVFFVRSFDRAGKERWNIPAPGAAWAVNLSADRRLTVAAFGDGTIRWYRADNGKELLSFFPHADRKRWVAWTPSGYYDASVGGEELIGWHVNRGPDQAADFFPASHFRDRFYRPDVVSRVLDTLDEATALAQANAEAQRKPETIAFTKLLPPVVTILAPAAESEVREASVQFRVTVRSPSGERVTAVRAFIDGRPAGSTRGLVYEPEPQPADPTAERALSFTVAVPPRDCTVAIAAETRLATSEPVPVKLRWAVVPSAPAKPMLYLLAVGVGRFANPAVDELDLPAQDARDVATSWKAQAGGLYRGVEVRVLTDTQATKGAILDGLEWLERQTTAKDVAILYFSGHGLNDPRSGEYLFLPYDADLEARRKTLLPDREVKSVLYNIPGKVLVFFDTCHSGSLLGTVKNRDSTDMTRLINELTSAENGIVAFSASTGRQQALESPEWKNGAFTRALLEALAGKAEHHTDNSLYVTQLESYLYQRVKELTKGLQTPVSRKPDAISDFPVAVVVVPKK